MGSDTVTESDLLELGQIARENVRTTHGRIIHNCWYVVNELQDLLVDQYELNTEQYANRHVLVNGEHKHHILVIHGSLVDGFHPQNEVWVDPSFDQFCDENYVSAEDKTGVHDNVTVTFCSRDELDDIRVLRADDDRRTQYTIPTGYKTLL